MSRKQAHRPHRPVQLVFIRLTSGDGDVVGNGTTKAQAISAAPIAAAAGAAVHGGHHRHASLASERCGYGFVGCPRLLDKHRLMRSLTHGTAYQYPQFRSQRGSQHGHSLHDIPASTALRAGHGCGRLVFGFCYLRKPVIDSAAGIAQHPRVVSWQLAYFHLFYFLALSFAFTFVHSLFFCSCIRLILGSDRTCICICIVLGIIHHCLHDRCITLDVGDNVDRCGTTRPETISGKYAHASSGDPLCFLSRRPRHPSRLHPPRPLARNIRCICINITVSFLFWCFWDAGTFWWQANCNTMHLILPERERCR